MVQNYCEMNDSNYCEMNDKIDGYLIKCQENSHFY
jgi:hypothetical protein